MVGRTSRKRQQGRGRTQASNSFGCSVSVDDGFLYIAYEVPKAWIDNPNGGSKTVSKVVIAVILPQGQVAGVEGGKYEDLPAGTISQLIESTSAALVDIENRAVAFLQRAGTLTRAALLKCRSVAAASRPAQVVEILEELTRPLVQNQSTETKSSCAQCHSPSSARQQPPGSVCASCKSLGEVPHADVGVVRRLFGAAVAWHRAQPWLTVRLNHVLRVECPWSPEWKYVHVIGGGGNCVPGMYIVRSVSELDREDDPQRKLRGGIDGLYCWAQDGAASDYTWETLNFIEDNNIPIVSGAGDPDPAGRVVPTFHRYNMGKPPEKTSVWLPSVAEMAYLQAACVAVRLAIDRGMLRSPPDHHYGDYRQFYPLDAEVEISDPIVPPGSARSPAMCNNRVRVVFPCVTDAAEAAALLSPLQKVVIADAAHAGEVLRDKDSYKPTPAQGSLTRTEQECMYEGLALKGEGNEAFKIGDFERALQLYTTALSRLPKGADTSTNEGVSGGWQNVQSNLVTTLVKLERWAEVCAAATVMVGSNVEAGHSSTLSIYHRRCLWSRGKAREKLGQLEEALFDISVIRTSQSRLGNEVATKQEVLSALGRIFTALAAAEEEMRWERLRGEGADIPPRFFPAAAVDPDTGDMYVHGGKITGECPGLGQYRDDLWVMRPGGTSWFPVEVTATPAAPLATSGHAAVVHRGKLYVYGGEMSQEDIMAHHEPESLRRVPAATGDHPELFHPNESINSYSLFVLDLQTRRWSKGSHPAPYRRRHPPAVVHRGRMWMFGGRLRGPVDALMRLSADTWSLNLATGVWRCETTKGAGSTAETGSISGPAAAASCSWLGSEVSVPEAREEHAAWVYEGGMFVFGGQSNDDEYLSDLWRLDLDSCEWARQHPAGVTPSPRGELAAATLHGRRVFMYGGYAETSMGSHYIDRCLQVVLKKSGNNRCCVMHSAGPRPCTPGARAGCALLADSVHNRLVLVGGYNSMLLGGSSGAAGEMGDTWVLREVPRGKGGGETLQKEVAPCEHCGTVATTKKCGGCRAVSYCTPGRQKLAWPSHKQECKRLRG